MDSSLQLDRRTAIKWVLAASAALQVPAGISDALAQAAGTVGYGKDPNLLTEYAPGKLWPLTLTPEQRNLATALSDVIIPAESEWPAASELGVVAFVDEWISAPYSQMSQDRSLIVDGLAWLSAEARGRYSKSFSDLAPVQMAKICDDICPGPNAKKNLARATAFFTRFRELIAAAYYTTPQGMKDLGYVGNVPLASYDGPPKEVLRKIGLA